MSSDELLTLEEVAARLRLSPAPRSRKAILTVLERLGVPALHLARHVYRVRSSDLEEAIERAALCERIATA